MLMMLHVLKVLLVASRFQNTKPNLTKAIEYAGEKLFDTAVERRQFMKEALVLIIAGYQNITQKVEQVIGYMKMRGQFSILMCRSVSTNSYSEHRRAIRNVRGQQVHT